MTILKEITLPGGHYFAPSVEIASQVEIDQIAELYSRRHGMTIGVLGGTTQVAPNETTYVVAHGNADGDFTKMSLPSLRSALQAHGVASGMNVVLVGCFTQMVAVGGLPTSDFAVQVSGFDGVVNVSESKLADLVNNQQSGQSYGSRTNQLESEWIRLVKSAQNEFLTLAAAINNGNALEFRDFLEDCLEQALRMRPIQFGNGQSPASARGLIKSWLDGIAKTSYRNDLWQAIFRGMSHVAVYNDFLVFSPGTNGNDGTGKAALLAAARNISDIHTLVFVNAEKRQAAYQKEIAQALPSHELRQNSL